MKSTAYAVMAIILVCILEAQAAKKQKKFCRGTNGIKYKPNEGYKEGCIKFTCVRKGKKIKMTSKPIPNCGITTPAVPHPPSTTTPPPLGFTLDATCDNNMKVFGDGNLLATSNDWTISTAVYISENTKVIEIECEDTGVIGGIVASTNHGLKTDKTWNCSSDGGVTWNSAYEIKNNKGWAHISNPIDEISTDAMWIWSGENWNIDSKRTVSCKTYLGTTTPAVSQPPPSTTPTPLGPEDNVNVTALQMNVDSLNATVEALQATVQTLLSVVTKQGTCMSDFSSSDCPVAAPGKISLVDQISSNKADINTTKADVRSNQAGIDFNKGEIDVNKAGIGLNKADVRSNKDGITSNNATYYSIQAATTNLETCLADVNSVKCPSSKDGKTSVSDAIMKNKDDVQLHHTDCPSPPSPQNGDWECDLDNHSCHLQCNAGFTSSVSTVRCQDGVWEEGTNKAKCTESSVYFVAGGNNGANNYHDTELYSPTNENLQCSITLPEIDRSIRYWYLHYNFYHNNTIYSCGPDNTGGVSYLICLAYNSQMGGWKTYKVTPGRRSIHGVILEDTLFFIGGSHEWPEPTSTKLPLTDQSVWTKVPNLNFKGSYQCVAKIDEESLVITGGIESHPPYSVLADVKHYNAKTSTETLLAPLSQHRMNHGCIVVERDNKKWLIVSGGQDATTEILQLDTDESHWISLGNLNWKRTVPGMIDTERGVMVLGGVDDTGSLKSVELLDWFTKQWKVVQPSLKKPRSYFGGVLKIPASMFDCQECNNGGKLLSMAPDNNMALCKDIKNNTCEKDLFNICPVGWHLCNPKEFNNRNDDWSYTTPALTFGQMFCRPNGGTSPFVITKQLNKDDPGNCGHYWSSRPGCELWEGAQYDDGACNNKGATALCCAPAQKCGNGVVDSPEEECDDGNEDELDDCLNSCAWRTPAQHGLNYCQ